MESSQSPEIDKLAGAIVRAQVKLMPAKKDTINPFFHKKYADLPAVWESLKPFRDEEIAITQSPMDSPDGHILLETQLTHSSGQWMRSCLKMRVAKDDPQGAGSALTYARRYALGCMTGLVTEEDDDGNQASQPVVKAAITTVKPAVKPAAPQQQGQEHDRPLAMGLAPQAKWVVPFGKMKGQPISDVSDDDVDYLLRYYTTKLQDAANATSRYRDEWENAIMEIRAEQLYRTPITA